jgi:glucose dehydrogenase
MRTGKLIWYFQTTHHDNWDYDASAPPALIDVVRNGKKIPIPALAQTTSGAAGRLDDVYNPRVTHAKHW